MKIFDVFDFICRSYLDSVSYPLPDPPTGDWAPWQVTDQGRPKLSPEHVTDQNRPEPDTEQVTDPDRSEPGSRGRLLIRAAQSRTRGQVTDQDSPEPDPGTGH